MSSEIKEIKLEQTRESFVSPPEGCTFGCTCQKCKSLNYTINVVVESEDVVFVRGPIMVRKFVSNHHQMVGETILTLRHIWKYDIKEVTKLKCSCLDVIPGLGHIYLTLNTQPTNEEINVNHEQMSDWFTNTIIAKLYLINRLGIPFRKFAGKTIGPVYVNSFLRGWRLINMEITDRLRMEGGKQIKILKDLWTRFDLIDMNGACLIVKFWDGIVKNQLALPLNRLSQWLNAFASLVKI